MYRVSACVGCGSQLLRRFPAVVAPFIESYVLGHRPPRVDLCVCDKCDLAFYDQRLTGVEIAKLYNGYRGAGYLRARRRVEPFYTRAINNAIGADEHTILMRRQTVGDFLRSNTVAHPPASILDFGGDAGQFIPELGARKYVYEISDVALASGVERHAGEPVDLVMLAHVLEHASEPLGMLRDELAPLVTDGGWLYVEVPLDRPQMPPSRFLPVHTRWVAALSKGRNRTVAADLVSTPLRVVFRGHWTPFTFAKMHEHLNHFSMQSLAETMTTAGWQPIASMTYEMGKGPLRVMAMGMIGRLS